MKGFIDESELVFQRAADDAHGRFQKAVAQLHILAASTFHTGAARHQFREFLRHRHGLTQFGGVHAENHRLLEIHRFQRQRGCLLDPLGRRHVLE